MFNNSQSTKRVLTEVFTVLIGIGLSMPAYAVWDMTLEDLISVNDAKMAVCSKIAPQHMEKTREYLERSLPEEQKKEIPAIRDKESYKNSYAKNIDYLNALTEQQKIKTCNQ